MIKQRIRKSLNDIEDLIRLGKYSEGIKLIVSTYELSFKELYNAYLGRVSNPMPYFSFFQDNGIKDIEKCMFGKWLGFLSATDYYETVYLYLNGDKPKNKKEFLTHLNNMNNVRISETHQSGHQSFDAETTSKEITKDAANQLVLFLKNFKLYDESHVTVLNKFDAVNIQKLNGEVQLYESLYETLNEGNITNLDVTYFANKVPKPSDDDAIKEYWSKTNEMIAEGTLNLRRILTVDDSDTKGIKLLWILFNMIPKNFAQLGRGIKLSLFKTSNQLGGSANKSPIDLLNMILMYNKRDPDRGHVWLFPGHQTGDQEQEYIHLYGSNNIMLFQKIYNNLFSSSLPLDAEIIKGLLLERKSDLNADNLDAFIDAVFTRKELLELNEADKEQVKNVYKEIFSDEESDDDIW